MSKRLSISLGLVMIFGIYFTTFAQNNQCSIRLVNSTINATLSSTIVPNFIVKPKAFSQRMPYPCNKPMTLNVKFSHNNTPVTIQYQSSRKSFDKVTTLSFPEDFYKSSTNGCGVNCPPKKEYGCVIDGGCDCFECQ